MEGVKIFVLGRGHVKAAVFRPRPELAFQRSESMDLEEDPPRPLGHLHLRRSVGESVVVNPGSPDEVVVKILGFNGPYVRLGFTAAKSVHIRRAEAGPKKEES